MEFDIVDSLLQDEPSQQVDLPLNAELISMDPNDTVNVISEGTLQAASQNSPHINETSALERNEESVLHLEEKNDRTYEPSSSESDLDKNVDPRNHSKEICQKRKRAKRGKANKKSWVAVSNKIKRMKGEESRGEERIKMEKLFLTLNNKKGS